MNIENIIEQLSSPESRNETIKLLVDMLVDRKQEIICSLAKLIFQPESIDNTNRFASLLVEIPDDSYINPLIKMISVGKPNGTKWLADYMYALGSLLEDRDDCWDVEESFVNLLGDWLMNTSGGEISWKSSIIMENIRNDATKQYYVLGAMSNKLFKLTRHACIRGLVNRYPKEAINIIQSLLNDTEPEVKEHAKQAIEWLKRNEDAG